MSPQRTCIGCRRPDDQDRLVRLVRVGEEVVDGTSPRLPGRGSYLHPREDCVATAQRRNALRRAFRGPVEPSVELALRLEQISPGWIQEPSGE